MKRITVCLLLVLLSANIVYAEVTGKPIFNPDGTIEYVFYSEGKEVAKQILDKDWNEIKTIGKIPDGIVKQYYESGKLQFECNYKDSKREGITKRYDENGILINEWNYKNGKLEGISKEYYKNGTYKCIDTYQNGKLIKKRAYDESGKLKFEWGYPIEKKDEK